MSNSASNTNWTDPVVIEDPVSTGSVVVKSWAPDNSEENGGIPVTESSTRVDGTTVPVLRVNNVVVNSADIINVRLRYDEFLPYIELEIYDGNGMNQFANTPGFSNSVTLVMMMPGELTYKKVSLDFYITDWRVSGGVIVCTGEYKHMPLDVIRHKQVKSDTAADSSSLTTWELFREIAVETGLGFASQDTGISGAVPDDGMPRICSSMKYKDYMRRELQWAGNDENEYMDAWVDLNGYIVLTSVSFVLQSEIKPEELTIKASVGLITRSDDMPEPEWADVPRVLTNHPGVTGLSSVSVLSYEEMTDNSGIYYGGAKRAWGGVTLGGGQSDNTATDSFDIELVESSRSGIDDKDEYQQFQTSSFYGFEMSVSRPVLKQRATRADWFKKRRMRMLKVKLQTLNLGLQRGTLVTVMLYETEPLKIRKLIDAAKQHFEPSYSDDASRIEYTDEQQELISEHALDNHSSHDYFMNYNLSGMYYIDAMEFEYEQGSGRIEQTLYLWHKNGEVMSPGDKYIYPGFSSNALHSV